MFCSEFNTKKYISLKHPPTSETLKKKCWTHLFDTWLCDVSFYSGELEFSDCQCPASLAVNREVARLDISLPKYRKTLNTAIFNFISSEMSHVHISRICHSNDKHSMVTPVLVKTDWFVKLRGNSPSSFRMYLL